VSQLIKTVPIVYWEATMFSSFAPDQIMGSGAKGLTRPLCPYPQYAGYKGTGDLKDAAHWACKAPATETKTK